MHVFGCEYDIKYGNIRLNRVLNTCTIQIQIYYKLFVERKNKNFFLEKKFFLSLRTF